MRVIRWTSVALVAASVLGCGAASSPSGEAARPDKPLRMGMMPKLVGIEYFNQCRKGAQEAAKELEVDLVYDGPSEDSVEQQARMVDVWIAQGFDIIAVAPNDPEVIAPALKRAKDAGIAVLTWDADANLESSGRETFVNQAPTEAIGKALVDVMAEGIGGQGKTVIVTGSVTSPNQNAWMRVMKPYLAEKYPKITLLETLAPDEDQNRARRMTASVLAAHPDLAGVWGITSVALPGAAEGVRQAGKAGKVYVTGLALPSSVREYVADGAVPKFVLWNPIDLGYLTVAVGKALAEKTLEKGKRDFGRLKGIEVGPSEVILGPPIIFDKKNIDSFGF